MVCIHRELPIHQVWTERLKCPYNSEAFSFRCRIVKVQEKAVMTCRSQMMKTFHKLPLWRSIPEYLYQCQYIFHWSQLSFMALQYVLIIIIISKISASENAAIIHISLLSISSTLKHWVVQLICKTEIPGAWRLVCWNKCFLVRLKKLAL